MGIFNKDPITRKEEVELREDYLSSKRAEKINYLFCMFMFSLLSIAIISFSIIREMYWALSFSVITVIGFIVSISKFSRVIEDIFENRIIEEDPNGGE